jgi:hypothetical protein
VENLWIDKEGREYEIEKMGDFHLFSVMEALTKMTRMKRRKEIEYLAALSAMYDEEGEHYLSRQAQQMKEQIDAMFDTISRMNTDAYGKENIPHYEAIMTEASLREMRDPFSPDYDKTDA